jgi:hypothetical protein
MDDSIVSLRGKIWAHTNSLIPPPFIEVPVPSQESECYGIDFASFYD